MERLGMDILGISETRWTGCGKLLLEEFEFLYSGDATYHAKGVGLLVKRNIAKSLLGYWPISSRIILAKFNGAPFNLVVVQVYAPTSSSSDEEI